MKMCEQILKKTAPQCNSNSLNCKKNQEKANDSPNYRYAAIKNGQVKIMHKKQTCVGRAGWLFCLGNGSCAECL